MTSEIAWRLPNLPRSNTSEKENNAYREMCEMKDESRLCKNATPPAAVGEAVIPHSFALQNCKNYNADDFCMKIILLRFLEWMRDPSADFNTLVLVANARRAYLLLRHFVDDTKQTSSSGGVIITQYNKKEKIVFMSQSGTFFTLQSYPVRDTAMRCRGLGFQDLLFVDACQDVSPETFTEALSFFVMSAQCGRDPFSLYRVRIDASTTRKAASGCRVVVNVRLTSTTWARFSNQRGSVAKYLKLTSSPNR